jgi:hypothetical protein
MGRVYKTIVEERNADTIWAVKPERKRPLGRRRSRWNDIINIQDKP